MLKLFISQPMTGKTDEEILQERNRVIGGLLREGLMDFGCRGGQARVAGG